MTERAKATALIMECQEKRQSGGGHVSGRCVQYRQRISVSTSTAGRSTP